MVLFRSCILLLIFCLPDLSIPSKQVLKLPTVNTVIQLIHSELVPGSPTPPWIPKSMDAQVPYISSCNVCIWLMHILPYTFKHLWIIYTPYKITYRYDVNAMSLCVCMCAELLQSFLTLCDPVDCSLPDASVHGLLQARILEWVASRESSQPRDWTCVS